MNGNDSVVSLGCTEIIREIISVIDIKAAQHQLGRNSSINSKKFSLKLTKPETIPLLMKCLNESYNEWQYHYVPRFASSLIIELYAQAAQPQNLTQLSRSNFYVSAYIDDLPLPIKRSYCYFDSEKYRCPWD